MGERPDEIEQQIHETRQNLNENLYELQEKVKNAFDWRTQFDERPLTMLAVAFGGGLLASALIPSLSSRRRGAYRGQLNCDDSAVNPPPTESAVASASRANGDARRRSDGYDALKGALMTAVATRLGGLVGDILSGYRDELRNIRRNRHSA
jgi:hypothetical protein